MSKIIASAAIRGAHKLVKEAEERLERCITEKGKEAAVAFPNTAYYLPVIYGFLGLKVEKVGDMVEALQEAKKLLPEVPSERLWLPYLGDVLDAGMATLFAEEIIEATKFLVGPSPIQGIWLGPTDDVILRTQGIKLVDGRMPGFAACVGALPTTEAAVKLARELQTKNILVFLAGHTHGKSMAEQLAEANIEMSWDTYLVPYGKEITAAVYALGFAARAAMTFGGIEPGDLKKAREILFYNKNRVFAFVLALGEVDDEKYATAAGAINYGFPTIADTNIPQILPTGICTYEHVVSGISHDKIVSKGIEVRGLKLQLHEIPIPLSVSPAFEGERVRREQVAVEFGGKYSTSFEYLRSKELSEVEDDKIEVFGPEIDDMEEGKAYPLGIVVDVAGRKMERDFEGILERRLHNFLGEIMGIFHMGQRNMNWIRISKEARKAGFKIRHFGVVIRAKLLSEFPAIVDKVQVTLYTTQEGVEKVLPEAQKAYQYRDERVKGLTDESVDTFYSCTLCQSYAPNHVCIISPERLGLCGAYNWLDGKASYEINPHGPNQPVVKGKCLDPIKGQWEGINKFVYEKSNKSIERFNAYSIMEYPMSSCGCFECIVVIIPEGNGFMVVNREYPHETPCGMPFSTLAGQVGGGSQTPGFLGVGKLYLTSRKFISAEGGLKRLLWMPQELKETLGEALREACQRTGVENLYEKIATEKDAHTVEELISFLEKVSHPALTMEPLM